MSTSILLVEDNAALRETIQCLFESTGYRVTPVPDGETALSRLRHERFEVIVTDIHIGPIDGIQVLTAARKLERPPALIVMTGSGDLETAIAALRAGAFDYLLKPVNPDNLLDRVAAAVYRRNSELLRLDAITTIIHLASQLQKDGKDYSPTGGMHGSSCR